MSTILSNREAVATRLVMSFVIAAALSFANPLSAYGDDLSDGSDFEVVPLDQENNSELVIDESRWYSNVTDAQIADNSAFLNDRADISILSAARSSGPVSSFSGEDRYETNALQAKAGWTSSEKAILVTGENWPDALAVSGLAGALDCPIILVGYDSISPFTEDALVSLGVSSAIIVGSTDAVSDKVADALGGLGIVVEERLWGPERYDTQMAVYEYGAEHGLWGGTAVVASGADEGFADALSMSAAAFAAKLPVFLAAPDGSLTDAQVSALRGGGFSDAVVVGSEERVSTYYEGAVYGAVGAAQRVAGANRCETSVAVAEWAVSRGYLSWDGAAFARGDLPYDALGGGALQGREGSVILLVTEEWRNYAVDALTSHGGASSIKFFGDYPAISAKLRVEILSKLGIVDIAYRQYTVSLDAVADIAAARSSYSREDILATLDPSHFSYGDAAFYQFADIGDYAGLFTADQLNAFIDSFAGDSEQRYGVKSMMRGAGEYFIAAAKAYNINEVYLVAHAAIESAWGCSPLSQGTIDGYEGYYNFYGIGAYDVDPYNGGAALAKQNGWDSVEKAIVGAARWISDNYIHPTVSSSSISGSQNTLYKMKWDIARIEQGGDPWHQYATSVTWATDGRNGGIAGVMASFYSIYGVEPNATGLRFEIPIFA